MLQNLFNPTRENTGFVDHYSHLVLSLPYDRIGIARISPRGLANVRDPLTEQAFCLWLQREGGEVPIAVSAQETVMFPWGCRQRGSVYLAGTWIHVTATLVCPAHNRYCWNVELLPEHPLSDKLIIALSGAFEERVTDYLAEVRAGMAYFRVQQPAQHPELHIDSTPDFGACWRLSLPGAQIALTRQGRQYRLTTAPHALDTALTLQWVLEGENCPPSLWEQWLVGSEPIHGYNIDTVWTGAQERWEHLLSALPGKERASYRRELRAAAVLSRCGYRGRYGRWKMHVASFCSITSWASSAFFWDSAIGALGLAEFDLARAEDALRVLFAYQRPDGCVPTHSYEHKIGTTFYPQAPILSWVLWQITQHHQNWDFVREILPAMRALFEWNARTQDHDGDGLIEVRYTGQLADNAPQYDRYVQHVPGHEEIWNIFLPPVASVALNSFHYADARHLALLYRSIGQPVEAEAVLARVAHIPQALEQVCWDDETGCYQDFEHQINAFNRVSVLTHFLPIWAGMPLPEGRL